MSAAGKQYGASAIRLIASNALKTRVDVRLISFFRRIRGRGHPPILRIKDKRKLRG